MSNIGRPPKQPPEDAPQMIRALAADGWSMVGIANYMGITFPTLERWFDDFPELRDQFQGGREDERRALHNMLYRRAMEKGDTIAAMFLLKARHGYREGEQQDNSKRVNITFNLPAALPMGTPLPVIEHANANPQPVALPRTGTTGS